LKSIYTKFYSVTSGWWVQSLVDFDAGPISGFSSKVFHYYRLS